MPRRAQAALLGALLAALSSSRADAAEGAASSLERFRFNPSLQESRGRRLNLEYLSSLPGHPLNSLAAPSASAPPTDPWNTSSIKGVHYIPSWSKNAIMTWVDYTQNRAATAAELGFAAAANVNTVRVTLHWVAWAYDPNFLANVDDFLTLASSNGLKTILALFNGEACCDPDPSWIPDGQYNSTGWVNGPGDGHVQNTTFWPTLDPYVNGVVARFGKGDARVVGFDLYYQPILQLPTEGHTPAFIERFSALVAPQLSGPFLTMSIIPGGEMCDTQRVPLAGLTVLSFENYNGNLGAIAGDTIGVQQCAASLAASASASSSSATPLPIILSGTMSRNAVPSQGLCDCLFEASGQGWVDIPTHPQVGVIITNLMIGVDGSSWGPPQQPPDRGLVFPNGTWFSAVEETCMKAKIAPVPPPPPGPPSPVVNFTAGGLSVGLRPVSRAIEVLALANDTRWFFNFSFVPPLWQFLPPMPHRDGPGCHHVGDLVLRVQPASETNTSSWAMYSTAQGADNVPATPLAPPSPAVFDASDLTPLFGAGGQPDTRYSLGLNVTRYFEQIDGAGGPEAGFRLRFAVTNTNATAVRIGSLGIPLVSNSNFGQLNLTQIAAFTSFLEGYPGGDHSYATMTRTDGTDTLVVYSCAPGPGQAPTPMEAWRPLLEDGSQTGGGVMSWEVVSGAFEDEWNANRQFPALMDFPNDPVHVEQWPNPKSPTPSWHLAETLWKPNPRQWNPPTTMTLQPGETTEIAVCFVLAEPGTPSPSSSSTATLAADRASVMAALTQGAASSGQATRGPRARDTALARAGASVVVPVGGYVIGTDMLNASLAVLPPAGASLQAATCDDPTVLAVVGTALAPTAPGQAVNLTVVSLQGLARGRARLVLSFSDGTSQFVHYYVLPPLRTHIDTYATHASTVAWLPRDFVDPFGRSASVMPWDREDGVHILQDARPFAVGLSDDAGAAANLALAARVAVAPTVLQASRLDDFVAYTVMGVKPDTALAPFFSLQVNGTNRIRMTLFYWDNPALNASYYAGENDKCTISPSWCEFNSPKCCPGSQDWIATYR
jgi:hypothetical protein